MAARAPELSTPHRPDDVMTAVLRAVQRAPLVPMTDEERALLAEVDDRPGRWIDHEDFASKLHPLFDDDQG